VWIRQSLHGCCIQLTSLVVAADFPVTAQVSAVLFLLAVAIKEAVVGVVKPVRNHHKHRPVLLVAVLLARMVEMMFGQTVPIYHHFHPFQVRGLLPTYRTRVISPW
jgi:hypothetical protein